MKFNHLINKKCKEKIAEDEIRNKRKFGQAKSCFIKLKGEKNKK